MTNQDQIHAAGTIATAWELIGFHGQCRIVGGRTVYEAVDFNVDTAGDKVRLARLDDDLRQINRYVSHDTPIEVLEDWRIDDSDTAFTTAGNR